MSGCSLVQRSPAECGVSEYGHEALNGPVGAVAPLGN